jgi:hypothetical protein
MEELYVPDYVLEEASAASYQMLPKKWKVGYQKELKKFTNEWKPVSERHWAKNDERKWSERKRNLHPLVTMDTDSLSREVLKQNNFNLSGVTIYHFLLYRGSSKNVLTKIV